MSTHDFRGMTRADLETPPPRDSKADMQKALAWADGNVWTMMHPGPDEGQGRQWMLMVNSSKMYFGPSFYQTILNAWFTERPND